MRPPVGFQILPSDCLGRISGTEWKPICWQFGISRPTAHRRWEYGLSVIVWRLNGRRVPTKRSRRYVVEGTRRG